MTTATSIKLKTGLLVGTLDIVAAFVLYFVRTGNNNVFIILKYIASGLFGKRAIEGGVEMMLAGLLLHYLIAFSFTLLFFWLYPKLSFLQKHVWLTSIVYGAFIWIVMNLVVVPLSRIGSRPFDPLNSLINMIILIVCIGLPLALIASKRRLRLQAVSAATH